MGKIKKGSRTHDVLKLLKDGKVHFTIEMPLPPKTRDWETSQAEDRHAWFRRAAKRGLIKKTENSVCPASWVITDKGLETLKEVE